MRILITGGAGFIGTNTALLLAAKGHTITIVDNLSRQGVKDNAASLAARVSGLKQVVSDVQNTAAYLDDIKQADVIIHLAGQTAVTTSLLDPRTDFNSNVVAGFELLEAIRLHNPDAIVLYSSTNKVYGDLHDHKIILDTDGNRYKNLDFPGGVPETQPLSFISPYGCSKGAMDEYMKDYARIFNLRTVVFRQSCIYGAYQMGVEDQGWVAHFSKQFLLNKPITIYGNGAQVRDLLFCEDLVEAYLLAIEKIELCKGQSFNIGGGPDNAFSLKEVITLLKERVGNSPEITYDETRVGDQPYFVSDNTLFTQTTGWKVTTPFLKGVDVMIQWQKEYLKVKPSNL